MRSISMLRLALAALAAVGLMVVMSPLVARSQFATAVLAEATQNDLNQPFLLATVPSDVIESLDDYRRYCQRQQWERAFKQLDKLASTKAAGLVPGPDGVRVPPALMFVRLISDLPEEGKKAFRLFYDADAKSLLEQAQGKDEEEKLSTVATRYLFAATGDVAADRWGDLLFERGEFARAMRAWRSVLVNRPDSTLSRPQLLVKLAIAAARDGRWSEFQELRRQLRERHAEDKVTLGGQSVRAVDHLEKLVTDQPAGAANDPAPQQVPNVRLPADAKPLWQFRWFAQVNPTLNREGLVMYDQMYGRQYASDFVPPTTTDGARVYSDMLGYDIGLDIKSGKLAWRSGRFFDLMKSDNNQNAFMQGRNPQLERSGILCTKDRLWLVARDPTDLNQNQQDPRYFLVARELTTGKEVFNSKTAKDAAKDWTLIGAPVVDDARIYVGGFKPNQPVDVYALCLSAADGKLLWNTKLGSYKNDPRQQYYSMLRSSVPSLLVSGGYLYVDTHAGSLVQLNLANGEIAWGINYESDVVDTNRYYNQPPEQCTMSPPLLVDGVLYFKGMRSRRLYAVDPTGPKVLWGRPVSVSSILCGVDRERVYLGGQEITAYDLKTQQLLWSKNVPVGTAWINPLMTADRIYQFTPRGIYEIDKVNGEVLRLFRGADMDSLGGSLLLTPNALLAVSNLAITAYPVEPSTDPATKPVPKVQAP